MNLTKNTIGDLLLWRSNKTPKANSVGCIENKNIKFITFKEYRNNIESLSVALSMIGLKHQEKICILSHTRKEWHFLDMSILSIGSITVPIYPTYTADEVQYIFNHCDAEIVIIENEKQLKKILSIIQNLKKIRKIISIEKISAEARNSIPKRISYLTLEELSFLGIDELQRSPDSFKNSISDVKPEDIATIAYTSGTTGEPKGAVITHLALLQMLFNIKKYTNNAIDQNDRLLTFLPLSHVLGRCESFFPVLFGCESVYADSIDKLIENIPLAQPTLMIAVPRIFEKIYEKVQVDLAKSDIKRAVFDFALTTANNYFLKIDQDKTPSTSEILQYHASKKFIFDKIYQRFGGRIRFFISGGAPLNVEIIKFMRNAGLTILEGYGLTETIAPCFVNPMNKQVIGSVGQPLGDVQVKFASDGEILLKSHAMFSEYYKNPLATEKAFNVDGWFLTGDIGNFDESGFLKITDRKKDIIITSGGKNVAPQKIENLLKLSQYISHSVIIGDNRKYLTALIIIEKDNFKGKFKELKLSPDCSFKDLVNSDLVHDYIDDSIKAVNLELASYESIKKFRVIDAEVSTDNYLTPSLKLKKKLVVDDYLDTINAMYNE